jgi:hypothetical protein
MNAPIEIEGDNHHDGFRRIPRQMSRGTYTTQQHTDRGITPEIQKGYDSAPTVEYLKNLGEEYPYNAK